MHLFASLYVPSRQVPPGWGRRDRPSPWPAWCSASAPAAAARTRRARPARVKKLSNRFTAGTGRKGSRRDLGRNKRSAFTARSGRGDDPAVRSRMERAFDRDFSQVRLHTDCGAEGMARQVSARAFTSGEHIAFGAASTSRLPTMAKYLLRTSWRTSHSSRMQHWGAARHRLVPVIRSPGRAPASAVGRGHRRAAESRAGSDSARRAKKKPLKRRKDWKKYRPRA